MRSPEPRRFEGSRRRVGLQALTLALVVALGVSAGHSPAQAQGQGNPNPGIAPIHSNAHGKSYGEWAAAWWNWAFSTPLEINPVWDRTGEFCHVGQEGHVWFLAGTFGGPAERHCTVPPGTALFFPIINIVWWATEPDETEELIRELAREDIDAVTHIEATINGRPVRNLWDYRAASPAFTLHLPEGAIADQLTEGAEGYVGDFYPAVADGYWLMLNPLPVGDHVIHFHGVIGDLDDPEFETEVIYHLTVQPPGRRR